MEVGGHNDDDHGDDDDHDGHDYNDQNSDFLLILNLGPHCLVFNISLAPVTPSADCLIIAHADNHVMINDHGLNVYDDDRHHVRLGASYQLVLC